MTTTIKKIEAFLDKNWRCNLLLFFISFAIYLFYFHHIFFNINSLLSSITLDSLKNYYTFVYHVKNDSSALHFSGMNYPFGEHIIYTDCQPIFTFILRLFPFTHHYLIGIMHSMMFLSFIITPLILNRVLRLLEVDKIPAFFISMAITFLSPQFLKINAGHFALAYGCIFPLSLLFILQYIKTRTLRNFFILLLYNTIVFYLHPYLGFCVAVFSFISLLSYEVLHFNRNFFLRNSAASLFCGVFPLVFFKAFMLLTDQHSNRTTEPFGASLMVENIDSILAPDFGPFQDVMEFFFKNRTQHYEGHTYLGFFTILLTLLFLLALPFTLKKMRFKKEMLCILLASFFMLLISFGIHIKLFEYLNIKSSTLNQFRAVCRFSWIFYYTLPVFLVVTLYDHLKIVLNELRFNYIVIIISFFFFSFNLVEAHSFFKLHDHVFWKYKNFFNPDYLNSEEKKMLEKLKTSKVQAILPLPLFHGGSEMYDRLGSNNSMIPSMIYSYHSGLPILSVMMSRTSMSETEDLIELFNSYKRKRVITKLLTPDKIFVLTTHDALLPDETRLLQKVRQFDKNDTLQFGFISPKDLLMNKMDSTIITIDREKIYKGDSINIVFIAKENRKPFITSAITDYESIFVLDSHKLKTGSYIVSFHYYFSERTYRSLATGLIITKTHGKDSEWQYNIPVHYLSGFYKGYGVFEYRVDLESKNKYEFILKGYSALNYKISDFMVRPEGLSVKTIHGYNDTTLNNFAHQ